MDHALAETIMKRAFLLAALTMAAATLATTSLGRAADGVSKAKADAFDIRMFSRAPGQKAYACFVRRYDAGHLAQHPKQKVSAMKLLVTAEMPEDAKQLNYSFHTGVKFRGKSGNFDASGYCNHVVAEDSGREIRLGCGVDCEGGGINVALSKDDKSAVVRLQRIVLWERGKTNEDATDTELANAADRVFRVERVDVSECADLVPNDSEEVADLRDK
jgi:hypothetical protein